MQGYKFTILAYTRLCDAYKENLFSDWLLFTCEDLLRKDSSSHWIT